MKLGSKEHEDMLKIFEKSFSHMRLDREKDKESWRHGNVYECGETNQLYKAFISGYSAGRCVYINS